MTLIQINCIMYNLKRNTHSWIYLLCGIQIMCAGVNAFSDPSKAGLYSNDTKEINANDFQHKNQFIAEKLQNIAKRILGNDGFYEISEHITNSDPRMWGPPDGKSILSGRIEDEVKIFLAKEYISAFPGTYAEFHALFDYGIIDTYRDDGMKPYWVKGDKFIEGILHNDRILYISLYFELFEYSDKQEFVQKAVTNTIGTGWRGSYDDAFAIYERQLLHNFNSHFEEYLNHLSNDQDATIALLRFFTYDSNNHMITNEDRYQHAIVPWGTGELCISNTKAMKLCTSAKLIDIPLIDDVLILLTCVNGADDHCATESQDNVIEWVRNNTGLINDAFEHGSNVAMDYISLFYLANRFAIDNNRLLPLLEAKLYINYPKLGMKWLASYPIDFEVAKKLGVRLFHSQHDDSYFNDESNRMGKTLISRYREYLSVGHLSGTGSFKEASNGTYTLDHPLFTNRQDVKELLRYWEEARNVD